MTAPLAGTLVGATVIEAFDGVTVAHVSFTVAGTYADADGIKIAGLGAALAAQRRNGKTVTLRGAAAATPATKTGTANIMSLASVAVSTDDVTAKLTDGDWSTPLADAAVPAQGRPF